MIKLDGVAPLMTDPPPIGSTTLSEKRKKKCDTWHVTCDTWHVTRDMWQVWGLNILSKSQLPSSYRLWFMILGRYFRKRMNRLMSDKAVCRTAPATPGLSIMTRLFIDYSPGYTGSVNKAEFRCIGHRNCYVATSQGLSLAWNLQLDHITIGILW